MAVPRGNKIMVCTERSFAQPHVEALTAALVDSGDSVDQTVCGTSNDIDAFSNHLTTSPTAPYKAALRHIKDVVLRFDSVRALALAHKIDVEYRRIHRIFEHNRPDAIVVTDDRRILPDLLARGIARRLGIPAILTPIAMSGVEASILLRRDDTIYDIEQPPWRRTKRHIASKWPKQVRLANGQPGLLFYRPGETLTLAWSGLLPDDPWVIGGSGVDLICSLGEDHRDYLVSEGTPITRIAVTGQPYLDRLMQTRDRSQALRHKLNGYYGLSPDAPLIIAAVPQYAEHGMTSWTIHRQKMDEFFGVLGESGASVLLSLHPRSRRDDYAKAAASAGIRIAEDAMIDILPAADMLTGGFSSTIRWAIGMGIPAIVVDAIQSNYRMYRDLPGVSVLNSHNELRVELKKFVADDEFRESWRQRARAGAARVMPIDGKAGARLVSAIHDLLERHTSRRK